MYEMRKRREGVQLVQAEDRKCGSLSTWLLRSSSTSFHHGWSLYIQRHLGDWSDYCPNFTAVEDSNNTKPSGGKKKSQTKEQLVRRVIWLDFLDTRPKMGKILLGIEKKFKRPNASWSKGESEQNSLANQSSITNQNILASQSASLRKGAKSPDASIAPGSLRHLVISLKGEDSEQKWIYMKINLKEGGNPPASAVGMISGKEGISTVQHID